MVYVTTSRRVRAPIRRRYAPSARRMAPRYQTAQRVQVRVRRPVRQAYSRRGYSGRRFR